MKISIKQSTIVKPASKTPNHVLPCSNMDLITPRIHIPTVYFYSNEGSNPSALSFQHLRESLGRALVPYYPVAGRLRQTEADSIEIDCNAEGVLLAEAVADDVSLTDFGEDFPPNPNMKLFVPQLDYSQPMSSQPILVVQVTRLKCGGICVGVGFHHTVVDGSSALQFLNFWGDIARSTLINESELFSIQPVFDRSMLKSRDPPVPKFEHLEYLQDLSSLQQQYDKLCRNATPEVIQHDRATVTTNINQNLNYDIDNSHNDKNGGDDGYVYNNINKLKNVQFKEDNSVITDVFFFTQDQISAVKKKAVAEAKHSTTTAIFTTTALVSAHVWRCVSLARSLHHSQLTKLVIPTDGRTRLKPQLPKGYFGNAIFRAVVIKPVGELLNSTLGEIVEFISKAIHRMDDEYLRSAIDYLQVHSKTMLLQQNGQVRDFSAMVGMVNWARLPAYDLDFGWGAPRHMGPPGELPFEGQCTLMPAGPTCHDNRLRITIALRRSAMVRFRELVYQI